MVKNNEPAAPGGGPIYDHRNQEAAPIDMVMGDEAYIEAVTKHVETTVGPVGDNVFHEIVSTYVHIDVLAVPPAPDRPWTTLVTCGMGARPMAVPEELKGFSRMELSLCLPPDWPPLESKDPTAPGGGPGAWVINGLQYLARMPFQYETWLGYCHTIPNGDPPEPIARGTQLCCSMIAPPMRTGNPDFAVMTMPGDKAEGVYFMSVLFLHKAEMEFKLRRGGDALLEKFEAAGVDELLRLDRPSVCRKRFLGLF